MYRVLCSSYIFIFLNYPNPLVYVYQIDIFRQKNEVTSKRRHHNDLSKLLLSKLPVKKHLHRHIKINSSLHLSQLLGVSFEPGQSFNQFKKLKLQNLKFLIRPIQPQQPLLNQILIIRFVRLYGTLSIKFFLRLLLDQGNKTFIEHNSSLL